MASGEQTRSRIRALVDGGAASLQQVADHLGIRPQTVAAHINRMPDADGLRAQMDRNKQPPRTITAFGQTKIVRAWATDPRCRVSVNTLLARLDTGVWDIEAALATSGRRRGESFALTAEEVAALKAAAETVRELPRVHRNTPADAPEHAATRELRALIRQAAGRASIAEIARAAGLTHQQAWRHLQRP
jgi:predicted ArsR family transcriptional regulator